MKKVSTKESSEEKRGKYRKRKKNFLNVAKICTRNKRRYNISAIEICFGFILFVWLFGCNARVSVGVSAETKLCYLNENFWEKKK